MLVLFRTTDPQPPPHPHSLLCSSHHMARGLRIYLNNVRVKSYILHTGKSAVVQMKRIRLAMPLMLSVGWTLTHCNLDSQFRSKCRVLSVVKLKEQFGLEDDVIRILKTT